MKKIMFNDKYGLTDAVMEGIKVVTRRIAFDGEIKVPNAGFISEGKDKCRLFLCDGGRIVAKSNYAVGEVVAIAQRYCDILHCAEVPNGEEKGWGNKMFVKAGLMPHHIEIICIWAERLQDISDIDCMREGITRSGSGKKFLPGGYDTPREAFADLIDKTCGKGTWQSNPWVFAYSFKLID